MNGSLAGVRVLVTRERPGALAAMLVDRGADVVHVPLIGAIDAADGGAALRAELDRLDRYDWLIVTSPNGAERVGAAVGEHPEVRLAAVGTATAAVLHESSSRTADLVPERQLAEALAAEFDSRCPEAQRVLIAQADRAPSTLCDALRSAGHHVTVVEAYQTAGVRPDAAAMAAIASADAVLFASGSAVQSWFDAVGSGLPPISVAIGPSTAAVAARLGLELDAVANSHSLDGLVAELERRVDSARRAAGTKSF